MSARAVLLVLACLGWGCPVAAGPAQVILIRHAEKPEEGHDLSLKGRERAAALVPYFQETPEVLEFMKPVAIYAQKSTDGHPSRRPVQTVQPLAAALKLPVRQFGHSDFQDMVKEIRGAAEYEGKTVLICWEHHVITKIANEFGVKDPPDFPSAFDRTWIISFPAGGKPKLRDVPQKLMYGDRSD